MGELGYWVGGRRVGRACAVGVVEMGAEVTGEESVCDRGRGSVISIALL